MSDRTRLTAYLLLCSGTLAILSYCSFSFGPKLILFIVFLASQFLIAPFLPRTSDQDRPFIWGPWSWVLLLLAAVALRFFHLTTYSTWPVIDEGWHGYVASEIADHDRYYFFYTDAQFPPFYIWGLGLFFKFFGISFTTLWTFPALISLAAIPLAYWAANQFFSRTVSAWTALLSAVAFWPLFISRFSHPGVLLYWVAWLTLGALGMLRQDRKNLAKAFFLGLCLGLGFYTFTSWIVLALSILAIVLWDYRTDLRRNLLVLTVVGAPCLILFAFLIHQAFQAGYGSYFLSRLHGGTPAQPVDWLQRVETSFSYVSALFFGTVSFDRYAPARGGFLDPLSGAFFLAGGIFLFKEKSSEFWFVLALPFLFLPGALTANLEMFRIVQILPLVLMITAFGIDRITRCVGEKKTGWMAVLGIAFSLGAVQLFYFYPQQWVDRLDLWDGSKSIERYRAFQVLDQFQKQRGPGWILTESAPYTLDQTLMIATRPFDALRNGRLDARQARWAGLLTNIHFSPYLEKEFPDARWYWLASDLNIRSGGSMLGLIPLTARNRPQLEKWAQAEMAFQEVTTANLHQRWAQDQTDNLKTLFNIKNRLGSDRLMMACFWQKAFVDYSADGNLRQAAQSAQNAIDQGYPAAHFYNELGVVLEGLQDKARARTAFEKALHCVPNYTNAADDLRLLNTER